jgi:trimeric autotransporter adhesin
MKLSKLWRSYIAISMAVVMSGQALPSYAVTGMGTGNSVSGPSGTIVFGDNNTNSGQPSAIFGSGNRDVSAGGAAIIGNGNVVGGTPTGFNYVTGNNNNVQAGGVASITGSGNTVTATATDAVSLGNNNNISGANTTNLGSGNTVSGPSAIVVGNGSNGAGANSGVLGGGSTAAGVGSFAVGSGATANNVNDVALGSGSSTAAAVGTTGVTLNGTGYTFAGTVPTSTVSVGSAGLERTITNVAAGRISGASTDAVNGSQLNATNTALAVTDARVTAVDNRATAIDNRVTTIDNKVTAIDARVTTIDNRATAIDNRVTTIDNKVTTIDNRVTAIDARATTIDNRVTTIDNKVTAIDARVTTIDNRATAIDNRVTVVDGRVTDVDNRLTKIAGNTSTTYTDTNGMGIRYARTNEAGLPVIDSYATGKGSTAVGYGAKSEGTNSLALGNGAVATNAGDVALGAGSTTAAAVATTGTTINGNNYSFAGSAPTSTLSVGSVGNERTITNVAAGQITATSTDAINGSQLFATNTAIEKLSDRTLKYDLNPDGTVNYTKSTMAGPVSTDGGKTGGTTITNVHQGAVNATSTDAVNGAQLYNIAGDSSITYTTTNGRGVRYARTNDTGLVESDAFAQGQGSTALGYGATTTASATNGVALGNGATVSTAGGVAIGSGSVASAPGVNVSGTTINGQNHTFAGSNGANQGVVSFGSVGNERQVTNVAAGQITSASTDAVNGSQLFATNSAINSLGNRVSYIDNRVTVLDERAVKYDINKDGTVNYNNITLGSGAKDAGPTTISNVADGVADTDAATVGQLRKLDKNINGGIAGAMAMSSMPQANEVGKTMASAGIGYYNGGSSLAVGASRMSDNGRYVLKGGLSIGTGKMGLAAGAGFNF